MSVTYQPGRYVGHVVAQGFEETKEKKHPMIVVKMKPTHRISFNPEGAEELSPVEVQYERTVRLYIDPTKQSSIDMGFKKLRYAGFLGTTFGELDLVGTDCRFHCEPGEYNGEASENWGFAPPPMESKPLNAKVIDSSVIKKLDSLFGGALKATGTKAKAATKAKETVPPDADVKDGDDVPF